MTLNPIERMKVQSLHITNTYAPTRPSVESIAAIAESLNASGHPFFSDIPIESAIEILEDSPAVLFQGFQIPRDGYIGPLITITLSDPYCHTYNFIQTDQGGWIQPSELRSSH